jgi:hypothetical protein
MNEINDQLTKMMLDCVKANTITTLQEDPIMALRGLCEVLQRRKTLFRKTRNKDTSGMTPHTRDTSGKAPASPEPDTAARTRGAKTPQQTEPKHRSKQTWEICLKVDPLDMPAAAPLLQPRHAGLPYTLHPAHLSLLAHAYALASAPRAAGVPS